MIQFTNENFVVNWYKTKLLKKRTERDSPHKSTFSFMLIALKDRIYTRQLCFNSNETQIWQFDAN